MKIGIECDNRSVVATRVVQDLPIGRARHVDVPRVDDVNPESPKLPDRTSGQPLVEKHLHAVFGSSRILSSSALAA